MNFRRAFVLAVPAAVACAPQKSRPLEIKMFTDTYALQVSWEPHPPTAREPILFKVIVRDKKTKAPIERGEGQVFANNADGQSAYDTMLPTGESGAYVSRLRFITAGEWALSLQFRKDSVSKLERPPAGSDIRLSVYGEKQ